MWMNVVGEDFDRTTETDVTNYLTQHTEACTQNVKVDYETETFHSTTKKKKKSVYALLFFCFLFFFSKSVNLKTHGHQ